MAQADSGAETVPLDLFGEPMRPIRDPRGRPAYAKNKENQLLVMTLKARSWSQSQIAAFMGCDEKTLRKHFSRELDHGALFIEGIAMQALVQKVQEGNVTAIRDLLAMTKATVAPPANKPKVPVPLGKKQALDADAKVPPSSWNDLLN